MQHTNTENYIINSKAAEQGHYYLTTVYIMTVQQLTGKFQPLLPKVLHYGSGAVEQHLLDTLPSKESKAFIITGNSLATKTDLIKKVEKLLGGNYLPIMKSTYNCA